MRILSRPAVCCVALALLGCVSVNGQERASAAVRENGSDLSNFNGVHDYERRLSMAHANVDVMQTGANKDVRTLVVRPKVLAESCPAGLKVIRPLTNEPSTTVEADRNRLISFNPWVESDLIYRAADDCLVERRLSFSANGAPLKRIHLFEQVWTSVPRSASDAEADIKAASLPADAKEGVLNVLGKTAPLGRILWMNALRGPSANGAIREPFGWMNLRFDAAAGNCLPLQATMAKIGMFERINPLDGFWSGMSPGMAETRISGDAQNPRCVGLVSLRVKGI